MISFLAKLFIKDYHNYSDRKVREQYGVLTGAFGIVLNLIICAAKITVGILSGAISVLADGINNLSDAGSSVISIAGFKLANKPVDKDHPFGHGRIEYISAMIVSVIIVVVGAELLISSVEKIITPETVSISAITLVILAASVLVKLYMFLYNLQWSKKLNAASMRATAFDSISDCVSTTVVLICSIVTYFRPDICPDSYAGIAVSVFIMITGLKSAKEILGDLLGKPPEKEFINEIEKFVTAYEPVVGIHDLIVHDYGPGRMMITLHAEVPADMDFMEAHDRIDNIEDDIAKQFKCQAVIHMDPVRINDPRTMELKATVKEIISTIDPEFTVHDFRMNEGDTHTNLIFDVVQTHDSKLSEEELKKIITAKIKEYNPKYNAVIRLDKPFV